MTRNEQVEKFISKEERIVGLRVDKSFRILLVLEWIFGIFIAAFVSPKTWSGEVSSIHLHLWSSILLGGVIISVPLILAFTQPGTKISRNFIAIGQMLYGSLLIHLMGGRIEAHFYIFGSLAFLSTYKQWDVLIPATVVVALDHYVRGIYWPESVYGVIAGAEWRFLEHAAWVVFEDIFLIIAIIQGQKDIRRIATMTVDNEHLKSKLAESNLDLERQVSSRTKELKLALEAKSQFLANMSHEIRTPMNAVISCTDLLSKNVEKKENKDLIKIVRSSGTSLLAIINDILDFSKIEAKKLSVENHSFKLDEVFDEIKRLSSIKANERNLKVRFSKNFESNLWLWGDSIKIKQVMINLISNALKFTRSEVNIEFHQIKKINGNSTLNFIVRDNGIGISEEGQKKLFKEFSQVDSSTTRRFGGAGLGLFISKGIIEAMDGVIKVESTVDVGSCFSFSIELEKSSERDTNEVHENGEFFPKFEGNFSLRILLAEDNRINQIVAQKLIKKLGYEVDIVNNGREAISAVKTVQYDLIFMDQHMPLLDGIDATKVIRRLKIKQPRIYALTASVSEKDKQNCLASGMDGFLGKPISMNELGEAIFSCIKDPREWKKAK